MPDLLSVPNMAVYRRLKFIEYSVRRVRSAQQSGANLVDCLEPSDLRILKLPLGSAKGSTKKDKRGSCALALLAQAWNWTESFHVDGRVYMPTLHLVATSWLILCFCSHSLESCEGSRIEHEESSSLVTHLARQFQTTASTETEVLPLRIPRKHFAILAFSFYIDIFKFLL